MEIKEVSDGYARNFLIAKKLAVPADESALAMKRFQISEEEKEKQKYLELANKLKGEALEFKVRSGEKGEVFGSVNAAQIKKTLEEKGYGEVRVDLKNPLKSLGDHKISVSFGKGITVWLRARLLRA